MASVHHFRRLPPSVAPCLEKLTAHAKAGKILGVAFVCLTEKGYVADTCGTASEQPDQVRTLLRALDAKIVSRQLRSRR